MSKLAEEFDSSVRVMMGSRPLWDFGPIRLGRNKAGPRPWFVDRYKKGKWQGRMFCWSLREAAWRIVEPEVWKRWKCRHRHDPICRCHK